MGWLAGSLLKELAVVPRTNGQTLDLTWWEGKLAGSQEKPAPVAVGGPWIQHRLEGGGLAGSQEKPALAPGGRAVDPTLGGGRASRIAAKSQRWPRGLAVDPTRREGARLA